MKTWSRLLGFSGSFCLAVSQCFAAGWPSNIIISDTINAPAGSILYRCDVSGTNSGRDNIFNKNDGEDKLFLRIFLNSNAIDIAPVDETRGIFKLNDDIGIAYQGTISLRSYQPNDIVQAAVTITKKPYYQVISPASIYTDVPDKKVLVGAEIPVDQHVSDKFQISWSGQIVLIKLKDTPINNVNIPLPGIEVSLCTRSACSNKVHGSIIDQSGDSDVISPRHCRFEINPTDINFGLIQSSVPAGDVRRAESIVQLTCTQTSVEDTKTFMEIRPTYVVVDDKNAIGLKFNGSDVVNDALMVKAKIDRPSECQGEDGWFVLSQPCQLGTVGKDLENFTDRHTIEWHLMKKGSQYLPSGTFQGSATVDITFQ